MHYDNKTITNGGHMGYRIQVDFDLVKATLSACK